MKDLSDFRISYDKLSLIEEQLPKEPIKLFQIWFDELCKSNSVLEPNAMTLSSTGYNIGSHYNGTNGRFTAPVDGRYLFNWYTNVDTNSNSTSLWGDWLINGNYSGFRFYTYVSHGGWELLTASIIFDLNTNDYVNVFVSTSGNYDGGQYGSFNGCLLG